MGDGNSTRHRDLSSEDDDDDGVCEGRDGSGIRAPAGPSCLLPPLDPGWCVVERCDTCEKFPHDFGAAVTISYHVKAIICVDGYEHVIAHCPVLLAQLDRAG